MKSHRDTQNRTMEDEKLWDINFSCLYINIYLTFCYIKYFPTPRRNIRQDYDVQMSQK